MFCPKCGFQQASEDIRFCSRCGLPIAGLPDWLAGGAITRTEKAPISSSSPRRLGITRGGKLMFLSAVLTPIFFGMCFLVDGPGPLLVPMFLFLIGLSLLLYSRFFLEDVPLVPAQPQLYGTQDTQRNTLPAASNLGMNLSGKQVRTSELARPPSVTEHTTKLLNND